jgi:hypothetical protein
MKENIYIKADYYGRWLRLPRRRSQRPDKRQLGFSRSLRIGGFSNRRNIAGQGTARESRASRKAATLNLLLQGKIKGG